MNFNINRIIQFLNRPLLEVNQEESPVTFDIQFDNVAFNADGEKAVRRISFHAEEKSVTALVGLSATDKITLTTLLSHFWDIKKGTIKIGGIPIKNIPQQQLSAFVSEIFQDSEVLNDSIYNNLKSENPEATDDAIFDATEKAQVIDFAWELPEGLHTRIGKYGYQLSVNEKLRLNIARAILKNAPILLLDEAAFSLDADQNNGIQKTIQELVKNKTLLIITDRLETIKNADQIVVPAETVEKPDELFTSNGLYSLQQKR
ncbi:MULTISPECIES: ATP-binding cassette domain-containing protein [unclassified Flavobacterium]|uniref:ATP-binding cassette domain-containing protein n=1 Tax=unclassified Flavobacterium TaxID=196869 RepID=UPI001AC5479C|nr:MULTISPECIES: ATP-binding cassette domain-containing protein [unclassified Flavobacterium]MBN9286132.1 ATP-binding cassette domain-containing protein [Flavobacterium sp.]